MTPTRWTIEPEVPECGECAGAFSAVEDADGNWVKWADLQVQADPKEIELVLSHDDLVLLGTALRMFRLHQATAPNVVLDVMQEGLDHMLLQTIRGERARLRQGNG